MDSIVTGDSLDIFAVPDSSPQSLRRASPPRTPTRIHGEMVPDAFIDDYTPSPHILNDSEDDYITEDDISLPDPAPSGRSSISSFPASVVHHDIRPSHTFDGLITPSRSRAGTPTSYQQSHKPVSPISTREHLTGFRNPSSVRALQMRDEFSDSEDLTPNHRRRGSRMSYVSYRSGSTHSTPGKRMSRSLQGSPVKNTSKLRKEFPLVLLHCSLIPSMISPKAGLVNEELLEAIVPEPYKKRWKLLQEKVIRNHEVRERGVLIPHPKDDYDMLEEGLLESLELEQPVISNGHYVGRSESRASIADSGFGSEDNSSRGDATDEEGETKCADCGGHVCGDKRWEVKVYAANGLMKAGAWGAAWSEMEKVDVQVSVALPEDVRQEIEARLDAVIAQEQELQEEEMQPKNPTFENDRTREIYGESVAPKKQEEIDGLSDEVSRVSKREVSEPPELEKTDSRPVEPMPPRNIDLQDALKKYIQLLLQDRRNIAIILLSVMLIFYGASGSSSSTNSIDTGIANKHTVETLHETKFEYLTTTVFSTSTSIALETSTLVETTSLSLSSATSAASLVPTVSTSSSVGAIETSIVSADPEVIAPTSLPDRVSDSPISAETQISIMEEMQTSIMEEKQTSTTISNQVEDSSTVDKTTVTLLPESTISSAPLDSDVEFEKPSYDEL